MTPRIIAFLFFELQTHFSDIINCDLVAEIRKQLGTQNDNEKPLKDLFAPCTGCVFRTFYFFRSKAFQHLLPASRNAFLSETKSLPLGDEHDVLKTVGFRHVFRSLPRKLRVAAIGIDRAWGNRSRVPCSYSRDGSVKLRSRQLEGSAWDGLRETCRAAHDV